MHQHGQPDPITISVVAHQPRPIVAHQTWVAYDPRSALAHQHQLVLVHPFGLDKAHPFGLGEAYELAHRLDLGEAHQFGLGEACESRLDLAHQSWPSLVHQLVLAHRPKSICDAHQTQVPRSDSLIQGYNNWPIIQIN
ncbi:hypothetical protein TanjilG_00299 [Lupinus angustifolius]|uniref:Uncharacterized protein n=1 Tax=Lupinus angustifolius TaxID=3871 RepID=A0A4P1QQB5_LUPAN|nr:hypothetical protein TanjilG_00299 [Lupinus angustifolius]